MHRSTSRIPRSWALIFQLVRDPSEPRRIRDLLQRAGLSQREAARKLGLHERTVRYWCEENGKIRPPKMAIVALERLAELRRRVSPKD